MENGKSKNRTSSPRDLSSFRPATAFGTPANGLGHPRSTGLLEFFPQLGGLLEFALKFTVTQMALHERDFFN